MSPAGHEASTQPIASRSEPRGQEGWTIAPGGGVHSLHGFPSLRLPAAGVTRTAGVFPRTPSSHPPAGDLGEVRKSTVPCPVVTHRGSLVLFSQGRAGSCATFTPSSPSSANTGALSVSRASRLLNSLKHILEVVLKASTGGGTPPSHRKRDRLSCPLTVNRLCGDRRPVADRCVGWTVRDIDGQTGQQHSSHQVAERDGDLVPNPPDRHADIRTDRYKFCSW